MTVQELCAQVQAPRGICQYCRCSDALACSPRCHWTDPRHTICSAAECSAKYTALQPAMVIALRSHACVCKGYKARGQVLCPVCWALLPWEMSAMLYEPLSHGLSVYYAEAVAFLKEWRRQA